jgi:hypothetical protein
MSDLQDSIFGSDLETALNSVKTMGYHLWEHVSSLSSGHLSAERWRALTRRAAASEGHEVPGANRSIDARSIVTIILFFIVSKSKNLYLGLVMRRLGTGRKGS